jgi:small GTP-binding protein
VIGCSAIPWCSKACRGWPIPKFPLPVATFQRLSAAGAAALSIWQLRAEPAELCLLLGRSALPPLARPTLISLQAAKLGGLVDQGLLWLRSHDAAAGVAGAVVAELHLHGGYGVAAALRELMQEHRWAELPATRSTRVQSPLATRILLAHAAAEPWVAPTSVVERQHLADQVRPYLAWVEIAMLPPRVVLAGPPNAGKSTLFNAWLQAERVTVSPHPGTTRDAVSAGVLLGQGIDAVEACLVDTAGIGPSHEALDAESVQLAIQALQSAWRVIWVLDAATAPTADLREAISLARPNDVFLLHRHDLPAAWDPTGVDGFPDQVAWLRGSILEQGLGLIQQLEAALFATLSPAPPTGMWLPLQENERQALGLAAQSPPRR